MTTLFALRVFGAGGGRFGSHCCGCPFHVFAILMFDN